MEENGSKKMTPRMDRRLMEENGPKKKSHNSETSGRTAQ